MKINFNFNFYKKYQQYKQSRPIRLVAEEVQEGCRDGCKGCAENWDNLANKIEEVAKDVSDLADTFEIKLGMPHRIEHDFGNGVTLLKRRAKKDEYDSFILAETINQILA